MSWKDCIDGKTEAGKLDAERAEEAKRLFDDHHEALRAAMGETEAMRAAAERAKAELRKRLSDRKRQTLLQARAAARVRARFGAYRNRRGEPDPGMAAKALLDPFDPKSPDTAVMSRWETIRDLAFSQMNEVLDRFRRTVTGGVRNKAELDDLVAAGFGEARAPQAARELFEAWSEAAEYLRRRFNAAGGSIPKRQDWRLPQHWESGLVRDTPYEEWRRDILPGLDRARMIDERTGEPFTDEALEPALREVHETIATEGMSKVTPSGVAFGRSLANRRSDHRFLVFKDAASWKRAHEKYGKGTVFDVMVGHVEMMSRDIAFMEIMGPNPHATRVFARTLAEKQARAADAREGGHRHWDRATRNLTQFDHMWDIVTGQANRPVGGWFPAVMASTRNLLTSSFLGSTALLAVSTDRMTAALTAKMNGLSATRDLGRFLDTIRPGGIENLRIAARSGFIAESWTTTGAAMSRYVGEFTGPEWTRRVADVVLRASFLNRVTEGARASFEMEFTGALADHAGKAFGELPDWLREAFGRHGMGESHWDLIRATPARVEDTTLGEAGFIGPADVLRRTDLSVAERDDLATRLGEMIRTERQFAVPTSSVRGRSLIIGGSQPGTIPGEFLRSAGMFKGFPMTILFTHVLRGLGMRTAGGRLAYLGSFFALMTLGGAVGLQMREIVKGRDPRPMTDPEFWGAAAVNGGGLGIVGDFFFSNLNRFGGGPLETAGGPVLTLAQDLTNLTFGNVWELAQGKDPKPGRDLMRFARRNVPGASLWYARLGLERLLFDQLQEMADPEFHRSARRLRRRYEREFGQSYWWAPGDALPRRAPDLSNVAEERPR